MGEVGVEIAEVMKTAVEKQGGARGGGEIESRRDEKRREILTSIAEKGLLPAREVAATMNPATSEDSLAAEATNMVSGTLVFSEKQNLQIEKASSVADYVDGKPVEQIRLKMAYTGKNITMYLPKSEQNIDNGIIDIALYYSDSSVFPVVCERGYERKYETAEQLPTVLEERVQNSILIVAEMSEVPSFSSKGNEVYLQKLTPDKFKVLIPQSFFEKTKGIFESRGISVVSVPLVEKQVYKGRYQEGVIGGVKVDLPDFETQLRKMTSNSQSPLFIHGVRLPTKEDMEITRLTS